MSYHLVICLNPTLQRTLSFATVVPGQVNRTMSNREDASGKGVNVTRILTELGEQALHLTQSGGMSGSRFLALCSQDGVPVQSVDTPAGVRTCYTLLDEARHQTTELVEPGVEVDAGTEERLREAFSAALPDAHTVVISGSKAPGFSDSLYSEMVAQSRAAGVRVILDIRGEDLKRSLEHVPDLVKINVSEFTATFTSDPVSEEADVPPAVRTEMLRLAAAGTQVVLTNGGRPALLANGGFIEEVAVEPVTPVNTIGCGDAVTAGIAAGMRRGRSLREALALGLSCAAKNAVQVKPGTLGA